MPYGVSMLERQFDQKHKKRTQFQPFLRFIPKITGILCRDIQKTV